MIEDEYGIRRSGDELEDFSHLLKVILARIEDKIDSKGGGLD